MTPDVEGPPTDPAAPPAVIETDALVIGAGPVGLFQVFQLGLQEIRAHVVDALPMIGGQCIELYPDKPIYDIPAWPVCTGRELVDRLLAQIAPFAPQFHLGQEASSLAVRDDGRFEISTDLGTRFLARAIVIAAGVGAFQPRRLKLEGLARHERLQLHHHLGDPSRFAGRHLVVVGGGDPALDAVARLAAASPASLTLVHRRDAFQAAPALVDGLRALRASGAVRFVAGQPVSVDEAGARLQGLVLDTPEGDAVTLPLDHLLVMQGLSPRLGPLADWGLALERKQLVVDTGRFETSVPGIHAVGDVNHYAGKRKLIVCGFHEATLAAFAVGERLFPDRKLPLQYTTSSPRLQALLGVARP